MSDFYGVEYRDLVSIIQLITNRAEKISDWTIIRDFAIFSDNIGGIVLKVRFDLIRENTISLSGNGWLISFSVATRWNSSIPTDAITFNISYPRKSRNSKDKKLEIHKTKRYIFSPTILSSENFRNDMAILMLFSSEWEIVR